MDSLPLNEVLVGDCVERLKELSDNSVDSVVTDPPYALGFMGKEWDTFDKSQFGRKGKEGLNDLKVKKNFDILPRYDSNSKNSFQDFTFKWAREVFRVLKPGGHLLSFGGNRTYHRMVVAIEDAGFEIRDMIEWIYGSGFPKSLNIGKAIDKLQGNKREIIKEVPDRWTGRGSVYQYSQQQLKKDKVKITRGKSIGEGWGTGLKPAHEPIVVARKPLSEKSVALNVLKWKTGGLNIDECRIGTEQTKTTIKDLSEAHGNKFGKAGINYKTLGYKLNKPGRFPANLILDEEAGKLLDEQSGGASRFFYCAKASKKERDLGLDGFDEKVKIYRAERNGTGDVSKGMERFKSVMRNVHPTVKPIKLMRYLVRLVTPKGGVVLDPFCGSGSTCIAAVLEGFNFIGIEREGEYVDIARARIDYWEKEKQKEDSQKKLNLGGVNG